MIPLSLTMAWQRFIVSIILVATVTQASDEANRDSNYYAANRINPNVRNKQYYAESSNVLQSLSSFSKLYVTFHNCVWSTYQGDGDGDTCGVETDDAYWYMGSTECFRANAAYSLYGVLKGQKDTGCSEATFINSLFTTGGVEAFTQGVTETGKMSFTSGSGYQDDDKYPGGITSTCYESGGNNRELADGSIEHKTKYNSGETSYGLACNGKKFALKSFKGSYCDHTVSQRVTDNLNSFNSDMHQALCIPIYSSYSGSNNKDGPLDLLYNSRTCSVREYPGLCPDPYALLRKYASAEERAIVRTYSTHQSRTIRAIAILLLILGILLFLLASLIFLRRSRLSRLRALKRRLMSRRRRNKCDTQRDGADWFPGESTKSGRSRSSSRVNDASGRKGRLFGRKSSKL